MKNEIQTESENLTETQAQNLSKQSRFKKWTLNLIAVAIGFIAVCSVLGVLDILAKKELRKTEDDLPKLSLYRWDSKYTQYRQFAAHDSLNGPTRDLENIFPNLVEDYLPYTIANYFKIFIRQSDLPNFKTHSKMQPDIITPELLNKLERPFIVCLGGSTTEPFFVTRNKYSLVANGTWAEELSRIMEKRKINGTVFCGGTGGYTTANDLLKLLRDVLEIEPDIVISYGGVNDFFCHRDFKMHNYFSYKYTKNQYPKLYPRYFIFPNLLRYITRMKVKEGLTPIELYEGVKSKLNEAEYMIRNWRIMNEICKLHDINFYAVVQPCIGSTERTRNEKELILSKWEPNNFNNDTLWRSCFDVLTKNYDRIKDEIPKYNFMYDFSGIFDKQNLSAIYSHKRDWHHVSLEGNRIIAENMFKMLFDNPTPVANLNNEETNHK